jgi:hypothetical protein
LIELSVLPARLSPLGVSVFAARGNHHFGRFDDRYRVVATLQLQGAQRIGSNHGGERLVAHTHPHLRRYFSRDFGGAARI